MKEYLIKAFGLVIMWLMIIATTMQANTLVWLLLALMSFIVFHFVCKWTRITAVVIHIKQQHKVLIKYLLFGVLIGSAYSITRFFILYGIGAINILKIFPASINAVLLPTFYLMFSNTYIALAEEIVFRGYVFNALPKNINQNITLIFSSCLFLLAHSINGIGSVTRIIELLFLGLVLGIIYIKTRSLWSVIGIHFGLDFFGFFLGGDGDASRQYILLAEKSIDYTSLMRITDSILPVLFFLLVIIVANFHAKQDSKMHNM